MSPGCGWMALCWTLTSKSSSSLWVFPQNQSGSCSWGSPGAFSVSPPKGQGPSNPSCRFPNLVSATTSSCALGKSSQIHSDARRGCEKDTVALGAALVLPAAPRLEGEKYLHPSSSSMPWQGGDGGTSASISTPPPFALLRWPQHFPTGKDGEGKKPRFSLGKRGGHGFPPPSSLEPSQSRIPGLGPSHNPRSCQTTLNKARKFQIFFQSKFC